MIHHWMTVVFAANWGFAALMLAVGYTLGWLMRRVEGIKPNAPTGGVQFCTTMQTDITPGPFIPSEPIAGAMTIPRETEIAPVTPQPVFQTRSGQAIESPRTWDQRLAKFGGPEHIPYEELEGMFLDQFLLRYFYSLMPTQPVLTTYGWEGQSSSGPWDAFVRRNEWAKEMPLLFEQMTGYKLNDIQLNNAIAEWARRLSKPAPAPEYLRPDRDPGFLRRPIRNAGNVEP